jgi:predicted metal-dependent enzyme (double-stranded beta helix superfamily)
MTSTLATTRSLVDLQRALDDAFRYDLSSLQFGLEVRAALEGLVLPNNSASVLTDAQRQGESQSYRRHLLHADPIGRYAIAALVWQPGQCSPVHAHHTWCSYAVIEGELSETLFSWNAISHRAEKTRSRPRRAGAVSFVAGGRGAIHRLGNPTVHAAPAISIHVYGVAGAQIATHVNDLVTAA